MYARPATRNQDFDRLIRTSYGLPPASRRRRSGRSVTMSADTGADVIAQPGVSEPPADFTEYVVDREPIATPPVPEPPAAPVPAQPPIATEPPEAGEPAAPLPPAASPPPAYPMPAPSTDQPAQPVPAEPPPVVPPETSGPAAPEAAAPYTPAAPTAPTAPTDSPLSEGDLAADMQAILTGSKVYDPATGSMRSRGEVGSGPVPQPVGSAPPPMPSAPDPGPSAPGQTQDPIFDRIARSMEYSNSFDLGTVDLRRRFDQFDQRDDYRRGQAYAHPTSQPVATPQSTAQPQAAYSPAADPFQDLPRDAFAGLPLGGGCGGSSQAMGVAPERSLPMYDTGEHVLAAGDLYPEKLVVGKDGGVPFSYGQLVSIGDFYDDVADLKTAERSELIALKDLIEKSTAYYRKPMPRPAHDPGDISHGQWERATGGRYLKLADDNYKHFSPPELLGMTENLTKPTNRSEWERIHEQAISEMKTLVEANPNASVAPFGPLATNAFGDHYLTDAFSSGHLINKELVINRFRRQFYQGTNTITPAGKAFLAKLATAAWNHPTAQVRTIFPPLEITSRDLDKGFILWNIKDRDMFEKLLTQIAETEPSKVENMVPKVLHDHLNKVGVEVTNANGDGPWKLFGDGYMDSAKTLPIMRKAVQQSVDNILGPDILVSQAPTGPFSQQDSHPDLLARVWKFVPTPTAAGRAQVTKAIDDYTALGSATLLNAAAELLNNQAKLMATELIKRKFLKHEDMDIGVLPWPEE